jgi:hypothetical protein
MKRTLAAILILDAVKAVLVPGALLLLVGCDLVSPNRGALLIQSSPSGAKISLWNQSGGITQYQYTTPHTFTNLAPGEYCITLSKDGYYEWHAIEYDLPTVTSGQTAVTATLEPKFVQGTNLALESNGATATASGYTSYGGYAARPDQAIDGTANVEQGRTFWATGTLPAWLTVTLPSVEEVRTVVVHESYHDLTYTVEGSMDGVTWSTLVPSTFSPHTGRSFTFSSPVQVQQVRLTVTGSTAPGSHLWKTNVYEFELWQY